MSHRLINNTIINRAEIFNLNNNIKKLDFSKYYLGNFKIYKLKNDGTFEITESNNRVIEVFADLDNNVIGYFFKGIYDENTKTITNHPMSNISNIGYINVNNDKLLAYIRAGEDAGKGATETWEINNNGESINSFYSINGNVDNQPVLWIGTFIKF